MTPYSVKAAHLSSRLNLKQIKLIFDDKPVDHDGYELIYQIAENKFVFIYNYGSVVFFNVDRNQQESVLNKITSYLNRGPVETNTEDFAISYDPQLEQNFRVSFDIIQLKSLSFQSLNLICMVIGESTALDYFENATEKMLVKAVEISKQLKDEGRTRWNKKQIIQYIGHCLTTKQEILADLFVYDQPDITWEDQALSRLYDEVKRLFEIEARYKVLDYKLKLIQESVQITVDLLQYNSQNLMELTVIILIAIEVFWFFFEKLHLFRFAS